MRLRNDGRIFLMLALAFLLDTAVSRAAGAQSMYDPLATPAGYTLQIEDVTIHDGGRQRDIPLRLYLPGEKAAAPLVLFSHGLGGSREGSAYLGIHWAERGYVAVFLQHPGSDASLWQQAPAAERRAVLTRAADVQNFMFRVQDVRFVLDQLAHWNLDQSSTLAGRLDLNRVGMSGHSFGAITTQAVSGQFFLFGGGSLTDPRIKAAVIFSPSSPGRGDVRQAFGTVGIPWMLMTGTRDVAAIGDIGLDSRLAVFPALPPGGKYELVLYNAEHSAFTERALPGDVEARNPNHHRIILALSTAFWDAYLNGQAAARSWLDGDGPRAILDQRDRWQTK